MLEISNEISRTDTGMSLCLSEIGRDILGTSTRISAFVFQWGSLEI